MCTHVQALDKNGEYIGERYVRLLHVPKSEMEEQVLACVCVCVCIYMCVCVCARALARVRVLVSEGM